MTEHESLPHQTALFRKLDAFLGRGRLRLWLLLAAIYVGTSTLIRIVLAGVAIRGGQAVWSNLPGIFAVGAVYDAATTLYLLAPFALYLALLPDRLYWRGWHRFMILVAFVAVVFGMIYLAAVEYFFFDEFNARFNFVAVEYLIYPHEVFVNIWESYPVGQVLLATAALTAALTWGLRRRLLGAHSGSRPLPVRLALFGLLAVLLGGAQVGLSINTGRYSDNRVVNELAMNGVYSFFNAAMNSELDYPAFYLTLPDDEADRRMRRLVAETDSQFFADADPMQRRIQVRGKARYLNVVVLLEESLGAEFVGAYGDTRGLTPEVDRLAQHSLVFTRTYATGTRTVRGMEGVTASFPPVPAESIVKRPRNEGMFNWSTVMIEKGYKPTFIYGGFGTFDNMNYFFGSNGYWVIDRTDMSEPRFGNIWGVSDEDLFRNAIRVFDDQVARGERIFSVVMTTSNHKPFTFPEGVPNVPAKGGGREAGVRYADYAVGKFFELARTKPWFEDTLFVIIGDHGARVYGKENIPLRTYEVPFLIYSPRHVRPARVDRLTSQIDVAPTVLGLLNFSYDSVFFGQDVLKAGSGGRAFVPLNHNRDIALFDGENLLELGFRKTSAQYRYDRASDTQTQVAVEPERLKDAISVFQEGYELYSSHRYDVHPHSLVPPEHQQHGQR